MNESDLIEQLAIENRIPVAEAERFINTLTQIIHKTIADGGQVIIARFGKFQVSHWEVRIGGNPRNPSQWITIPKLNTPKFVGGEKFKRLIK